MSPAGRHSSVSNEILSSIPAGVSPESFSGFQVQFQEKLLVQFPEKLQEDSPKELLELTKEFLEVFAEELMENSRSNTWKYS